MKISFFTTYKKNDVGIYNYSDHMLHAIQDESSDISFNIVGLTDKDEPKKIHIFKRKAYFQSLGREMNKGVIAHIQHEYSLFGIWTNPFINMFKPFFLSINVPVILTAHEIEERKKSRVFWKNIIKMIYYPLFSKYLYYVHTGMFLSASHVIVHTNAAKNLLCKRGVSEDKISVIHHGISTVVASSLNVEEAKAKFGLEGKYVITTFGYITYRKGVDLLLQILAKLPENVVYLIAGSAPEEAEQRLYFKSLESLILAKNLASRVRITGFVPPEQVKDIMRATDIYLYPSRQITASAAVSEGIAYHMQILASALPFILEMNEEQLCVETFKPSDENDLFCKIMQLMQNPNYAEALIKGTYSYQKANSYKIAAQKTIALYKKINAIA